MVTSEDTTGPASTQEEAVPTLLWPMVLVGVMLQFLTQLTVVFTRGRRLMQLPVGTTYQISQCKEHLREFVIDSISKFFLFRVNATLKK